MSVNIPPADWRGRTEGGIPIKVVERSGSFGAEDADSTEVFIIEADRLADFALESFPLPFALYGTVFYPRPRWMTSLPALVTKRVRWEGLTEGRPVDPFGNDPGAPAKTYERFVKVTIDYGTSPANDQESDPDDPWTFLEITSSASGEFLNSPVGGKVKWDDEEDVESKDIPNTTVVSLVEWTARWPQIPYTWFTSTLLARLRSKMGKVNEGAMALFHNAPAETVMFMGYSMRQQHTWRDGYAGQSPVELELKFLEKNFEDARGKQVTHQHTWRPGRAEAPGVPAVSAGWYCLLFDGKKMHAKTNLDQIFKS